MRKVIFFMLVSIDGYFEGPNHELDWHNVDGEFNKFAVRQLEETGILLFGRSTYEMMANFWPTETARENDPVVAEKMNNLPKIVFSKTLKNAEWNNTRLMKGNIAEEILSLKRQPGKYISVFGSSNMAISLAEQGLIDEYRIMVNPVILGKGNSLFEGLNDKIKLKLIKTKIFKSGNILMYLKPMIPADKIINENG